MAQERIQEETNGLKVLEW